MAKYIYQKNRHRTDPASLDDSFGLDVGFLNQVRESLLRDNNLLLHELIDDLHPADMADLLEHLSQEDCSQLVLSISDKFNPDILPELDKLVRETVLLAMGLEKFANLLRYLDSDDVVYIVGLLGLKEREALFSVLPASDRIQIEGGLRYGADTAGRLIQRELVAVPGYWSVGETIDYLRSAKRLPDEFYVVFIVDPHHHPIGLVRLDRLLQAKRPISMSDIISDDVEVVLPEMDREDVAYLFRQRDLVTAPVVDKSGRLIGQITFDDIVDVIEEEVQEDAFKLAGVGADNLYSAVLETVQNRFSWLVLNLVTAIAASFVISRFQAEIEKTVALAVLMPIIASMGGNAGTQTLTIAVRSLATKDIDPSNYMRFIRKESLTGLANGILFAFLSGLITFFWFEDTALGLLVAVAMTINLMLAGLAGITIPIALSKLKIDPAASSSVLLTTVTDTAGFLTFLALASIFLV